MSAGPFVSRLEILVSRYRSEVASPHEHLSLLRWQMAQRHALDDRTTMPGHITTSAFVVSPDHSQTLLIDHASIGRWLQPGGHYETAEFFLQSAAREAIEETGVAGLVLHPWHREGDIPFNIDSHDVPGKASRGEMDHVHHDLQYLFVADPALPLAAQLSEVNSAAWHPVAALDDIAPRAARRLRGVGTLA